MRANIILLGYLNKTQIEKEITSLSNYSHNIKIEHNKLISTIKEKMIDSPYFMDEKNKIFIP
jgi:hypothetical protein